MWGNTKSDLGDYKGAITDYTQAIRLNPDSANAYILILPMHTTIADLRRATSVNTSPPYICQNLLHVGEYEV
jgi:tetratricopeptide (TPR) repeat protein